MEEELYIRYYFNLGFSNDEILVCLSSHHGIVISYRTLKRRLRKYGLYRKKYMSDLITVAEFIDYGLSKAGCLHGYRWVHLKCIKTDM